MLSPVEVRRIQEIIATVYCVPAAVDTKGATVVRVVPPAPKASPTTIPRAAGGRSRVTAPRLVQSPR